MKILEKLIVKEKDIYFAGCLTEKFLPNIKENYLKICSALGIDVATVDLICCGLPAKNSGNDYDFIIKKWNELIESEKIKTIYTSCPSCFFELKQRYNAKPILEIIWERLKEMKEIKKLNLKLTYHDPCHFSHYENFIEIPRKILRKIGCKIVEMKYHGKNSMCCGAGGGMINNNKTLANRIAEQRLSQVPHDVDILITSCPLCYLHLKNNAEKLKMKLKIYEISELIVDALNFNEVE